MDKPDMLLACYLSGQISERQWQEHLKNSEVAKRYRQHKTWLKQQAATSADLGAS